MAGKNESQIFLDFELRIEERKKVIDDREINKKVKWFSVGSVSFIFTQGSQSYALSRLAYPIAQSLWMIT